ncbi:glycosyltransferase family 2 protein [Mucilaginibacter sp.]|uniref:glycosyltransferase family 2 protein n=1 Tax=Mucilaginibacter sp. TaxID=1882438 RepID=UPI00284DEC30|nr:glycosyltransferase family 2 protein [Mucilaginibacter sp.]MDR3693106.1 glycosyltransferase family 2 protein [Mucilaginibacter sp.]
MDTRKSVSIVIPNYNGRHLLQEYLPYTYEVVIAAGIIYEIIIVDDGSKDGSVEFIRSAYPEIKLVVNPENKGFSYACNRGIEIAQHELILLLNADVKLTPGYFDQQWKYFLRWDTFGVMGRIIDMEGDHILEAALMPKLSGYQIKTHYLYYSENEKDRMLTWYLPVTNALVNAEKLKKMGGFYKLFETGNGAGRELSVRAWRLDWKCYYENQAICRRSAAEFKKSHLYFHDTYFLHAIHLGGFELFAWHVQIIFADVLPKLLSGQAWILKEYRAVFKNNEAIKRYKIDIKKLMDENDTHMHLSDIVKKIRASVQNKNITRFK